MSYQISMNNFQTSLLKVSEMDNNHVRLSQTLLKTLWDFFYLSMGKMYLNIEMFEDHVPMISPCTIVLTSSLDFFLWDLFRSVWSYFVQHERICGIFYRNCYLYT